MAEEGSYASVIYNTGEMVALIFLEHVCKEAAAIIARPGPSELLILGYGRLACTCRLFYKFLGDNYVRENFWFEYYRVFEMVSLSQAG